MPDLIQALARERIRDREQSIAAHVTPFGDPPSGSRRRPRRVTVRCGYWLISIGCRLVSPDLTAATR
jgi:hypothetical protein